MIAKLKGTVESVDADSAVIDVNGVGYLVSASARTLRDFVVGGAVTVLVETIVREDAIAGIANHISRYWAKRMREKLAEQAQHQDCGLEELPLAAARRLAGPAAAPTAEKANGG